MNDDKDPYLDYLNRMIEQAITDRENAESRIKMLKGSAENARTREDTLKAAKFTYNEARKWKAEQS